MSDTHERPIGSGLFNLTGRVSLVTGSTQGLGLAIARGLGQAGATVVLNGRTQEKLDRTADDFRGLGLKVSTLRMDVTDDAEVESGIKQVLAEHGRIDILVNNVGIHRRAPLAEMTPDDWRAVIEVNLTSAFLVSRSVVGEMIQNRSGKIINICSLMSEIGRPTTGNYAAAKGGLKMLTRAMAVEWAGHGIQANGIGPGYFITDLTEALADNPEFNSWVCSRTPAGRWGHPDELVGAAVFLASTGSDFVNGQIIYVDGGMLAAV